jgi:hypothetical protein
MMIPVADLVKRAEKFTSDNAPLILTVVGTAGVLGTGILAFKGGLKASDILAQEWVDRHFEDEAPEELTLKEKLVLTWTCYTPACGVAVLTIASIIGANQIGARRTAAMAAAFTISEKAFDEYKDQVKEKFGEKKENTVKDAAAKKRVNDDPPTEENTIVVTNAGDQIFQDSWSGRYFRTTAEQVKQSVNQLNHMLNLHGYASLTDFYELLGLAKTRESDELGWNSDKLLDIYLAAVMHDEGNRAVLAIEYRVTPIRDYFRTR